MTPNIESILRSVRVRELNMRRARQVEPSTPLGEVYRILDEERRGAVLVVDAGRVVGIFTQRDILYRTALEGARAETPIGELMTAEPVTLDPRLRLADAIRVMTDRGFRQLPLVDEEGRAVGMLTSRDIVRFIADYFPGAVLNLPPRLHQQLSRPEGG